MVNALALMVLMLLGGPARAADLVAGVDAGYAFRSQDDGRNHGAAASVFLDVPLPGPFALRPEISSLGFGASEQVPAALGFFGGSLSIVYSFDDSDVEALASVGPLGGVLVDAPLGVTAVTVHGGALAAVGLRFPVAGIVDLDARVLLPFVVAGPRGIALPGEQRYGDGSLVELPLQTAFVVGFALSLDRMFAAADEPASSSNASPGSTAR